MAFTEITFDPATGWNNSTSFPTTPASEADVRERLQELHDQTRDYINDTLIAELESVTSGSSGAENIGSAAISGVEVSPGVSATTVRDQIVAVKAIADTAVSGSLTPGCINASNLFAADVVDNAAMADDAIDSDQIADGSIDTVHLSADCVTGAKVADDAIDSEHIAAGALDTEHYANLSVTEGKVAAGAITETKIGAGAVTAAKLATTAKAPTSIWTGSWTTGTITLDVSNYSVFMIVTGVCAFLACKFSQSGTTKIEGSGYGGYASATNVITYVIDISVSGTTLTKNVFSYIGNNGTSVSVTDGISSVPITAIYGVC